MVALATVVSLESGLHRFECGPLQIDVEGGVDSESIVEDGISVEMFEEKSTNFFREITGHMKVVEIGMALDHGRRGDLGMIGGLIDISVAPHAAEHITSARFGRLC